jgi:nitrite reductase/ring-hydroxylating ferredoxin subunit
MVKSGWMVSNDSFLLLAQIDELEGEASKEVFLCHERHPDWPISFMVIKKQNHFYCYLNICPHAGHPLNLSDHQFLSKEGDSILCRSHGARFKVRSGECFFGPCVGSALGQLKVKVDAGNLLVDKREFEKLAQAYIF